MSGLVKGVKKVLSKVVSGVKKVFKKIASSKIGKVILIAAAIYLGGAALGAWSVPNAVPFAANINGAWTAAGSQAAQAAAAQATHAGVAADAALMGADAIAASEVAAGTAGTAATVGAGSLGTPVTPPPPAGMPGPMTAAEANANAAHMTGQSAVTSAPTDALATGGSGAGGTAESTVSRMMQKTKDILAPVGDAAGKMFGSEGWIARNPVPSLMATSAVAGAFTPDGIDVAREESRLREEERTRRREDFLIGDVDVGRPNGTQLTRGGGLLFNRGGTT